MTNPTPIVWYDADGLRYCSGCHCYMVSDLFQRNRAAGTPDGRKRHCMLCTKRETHSNYLRHRARHIAKARAWQAAHPERTRETGRLAQRVYDLRKRLERATARDAREERAG